MSNLDELLGTAAQNPRAVEAANAIKEEMPACLREINNLMHQYEANFSELITIIFSLFGKASTNPSDLRYIGTLAQYDRVPAHEFWGRPDIGTRLTQTETRQQIAEDQSINFERSWRAYFSDWYTLAPGAHPGSMPNPYPYGYPSDGSWHIYSDAQISTLSSTAQQETARASMDYISTPSNGVLGAGDPWSQAQQTVPDTLVTKLVSDSRQVFGSDGFVTESVPSGAELRINGAADGMGCRMYINNSCASTIASWPTSDVVPQAPMKSFRQERFGHHAAYDPASAENVNSTHEEVMENGEPFIESFYIDCIENPDDKSKHDILDAFEIIKARNHGGFLVGLAAQENVARGAQSLLSLITDTYTWTGSGVAAYGPESVDFYDPYAYTADSRDRQRRNRVQVGAEVSAWDLQQLQATSTSAWANVSWITNHFMGCKCKYPIGLGLAVPHHPSAAAAEGRYPITQDKTPPSDDQCARLESEGFNCTSALADPNGDGRNFWEMIGFDRLFGDAASPYPFETTVQALDAALDIAKHLGGPEGSGMAVEAGNVVSSYSASDDPIIFGGHEGASLDTTVTNAIQADLSPPKFRWFELGSIFGRNPGQTGGIGGTVGRIPLIYTDENGVQHQSWGYQSDIFGNLARAGAETWDAETGEYTPNNRPYDEDIHEAMLAGTSHYAFSRQTLLFNIHDTKLRQFQQVMGFDNEVYSAIVDQIERTRELMREQGSLLDQLTEQALCVQRLSDEYDRAVMTFLQDLEEPEPLEFALNFYCKLATGAPCTAQATEIQEQQNRAAAVTLPDYMGVQGFGRRILYREQCFLLSFINDFIDYKVNTVEDPAAATRNAGDPTPPEAKRLPYYNRRFGTDDTTVANACIQLQGDPYGYMNRLTQSPSHAEMFTMRPDKLARLQPMIKLYKVNYDDDGREYQVNFPFNAAGTDISAGLLNKNDRGSGVGIKKFMFVYDGSNPFAAKKSIKAKLVIFANSFDDLLKERSFGRYVDLALKTIGDSVSSDECTDGEKSISEENDNLSKLNFRLKAVVGYAKPSNESFLTSEERKAIYNSYVTLNLTPTVHDFNFDDMGRVTFTINYLAYVEDFFDQSLFNVFSEIETTKQRTLRDLQIKKWSQECDDTQINNIKQSFANQIAEEKRISVQSVVAGLLRAGKVRYLNIPYDRIRRFTEFGPYADFDGFDVESEIRDGVSNAAAWETLVEESLSDYGAGSDTDVQAALAVTNPNSESLPFFYISDLVDVILEQIGNTLSDMPGHIDEMTENTLACDREILKDQYAKFESNFTRFRLLLGPLELVNPANISDSRFASMGDIPISLKYFVGWLTDKLARKDESVYPLAKFLNDLFNNLVRNFMNSDDCYGVSVKQKIRVQQAAITAFPDPSSETTAQAQGAARGQPLDKLTRIIVEENNNSRIAWSRLKLEKLTLQPILSVMGPRDDPRTTFDITEEINYLTFFAGRTQPLDKMRGIRQLDEKVGIFHYMIGQPDGIVKKIGLKKTDSKGLAEVRFEQDGYDGLKQLRVVYDVDIKTFADPTVFPGQYIFVEPLGFAPNMSSYGNGVYDLSEYGIGGYCMVYRSTHTFGPGVAESQLEAKWVNAIESSAEAEEREAREEDRAAGDNETGINKCSADWRSQSPSLSEDASSFDAALTGQLDEPFSVMGFFRDTVTLLTGDD